MNTSSIFFSKYNNVALLKEGYYIFKYLNVDMEGYTLLIRESATNLYLTSGAQFHVKLKLSGGLYVLKMWKFRICLSFYVKLRQKIIPFFKNLFSL